MNNEIAECKNHTREAHTKVGGAIHTTITAAAAAS